MDDLTRCLYEFVWEKRLGSLAEDKEYQERRSKTSNDKWSRSSNI